MDDSDDTKPPALDYRVPVRMPQRIARLGKVTAVQAGYDNFAAYMRALLYADLRKRGAIGGADD